MRKYSSIALATPEVLLPSPRIKMETWSVVACDQFTSEPEYWNKVASLVGNQPSTLNLILPELYLGSDDEEQRIEGINANMRRLLEDQQLVEHEAMVYVERQVGSAVRRGLVVCVDLEDYDFAKGSTSLIRATEGTIVDRLPPRVRIRRGAALELPHIMVLVDDPEDRIFAPLTSEKAAMTSLYDFELMQGGGRIQGFLVPPSCELEIVDALKALADPNAFCTRYDLPTQTPVLLYAMGDGNHSLATAKAIWEGKKESHTALDDDPARYALVELVNLHESSLVFEPIHRMLFELDERRDVLAELASFCGGHVSFTDIKRVEQLTDAVRKHTGPSHVFGVGAAGRLVLVEVFEPKVNLAVGTLQSFLDTFMASKGARELDYIHGHEALFLLGRRPSNMAFYLPGMSKHDLFKTVILDGALPRKTFSMGEAHEKRYYLECRKLA